MRLGWRGVDIRFDILYLFADDIQRAAFATPRRPTNDNYRANSRDSRRFNFAYFSFASTPMSLRFRPIGFRHQIAARSGCLPVRSA